MKITITEPSLVLLLGISGSGKSTFAKQYFAATQIVSSDFCRALICDDENNQAINEDTFALLHWLVQKRLEHRKLTVIDATNVKSTSREPLLALAKNYEVPAIAIVFNFDLEFCLQQNAQRTHRVVPAEILTEQFQDLQSSLPNLKNEGFHSVYEFTSVEEISLVTSTVHHTL